MTVSVFPRVIRDGLVVDYDPAYSASFNSSENRFTYSQTFDNAAWVKTEMAVTSAAGIAPDGTNTAFKLVPSTNALSHHLRQTGGISTTDIYTYSIYARAAGYNFFAIVSSAFNACFNLQTGVVAVTSGSGISANIVSAGNGWWRCSITISEGSNSVYFLSRATQASAFDTTAGNGTSGALIWGAQLERARNPSTYTATTASAITRGTTLTNQVAAIYPGTINGTTAFNNDSIGSFYFNNTINDNIALSTLPDTFWNASSWTVLAWAKFLAVSGDNGIFGHGSATLNNGLHLGTRGTNVYYGFFGNDMSSSGTGNTLEINRWYHIAWAYDNAQKQKLIYINGRLAIAGSLTGAVGYTGTGTNTVLGYYPWPGNQQGPLNGWLGRVQMYNRVLAAPEVSQIFSSLAGRHGYGI